MNPRTQWRKSELIAPAESALRRASDDQELQDAWSDYASGFADESVEREYLLDIYMQRNAEFKKAEAMAKMMRV